MSFKKLACVVISAGLLLGTAACKMDSMRAADAGLDLASAATISDAELKQDAKQMRTLGDTQNKVAPAKNKYAKRLNAMTKKLKNEDGLDLNFKVYLTSDINANATPDGSIRVYSGLMDMMNDDELFFIVGHEIGHVKNGDSLDAMRLAYAASAGRKGVGAASDSAAALSDSMLGDLLEAVINAQFSQSQEHNADTYGYNMMKKYNKNPKAAVSALQKIDKLGESGGFLASHPNSAERAKQIEQMILENR